MGGGGQPSLRNFANISAGIGPLLPKGTDATALFTQPSTQWLTSVQSMLKGSDTLRHMQIEAINSARRQASELASTLARAKSPVEAGKAAVTATVSGSVQMTK